MRRKPILLGLAALGGALLIATGVLGALLLLGGGESGQADTPPEILKSSPGSSAPANLEAPVIVSSRPGATSAALAPINLVGGDTRNQQRGLTVTGSASATLRADKAFVVAALQPRTPPVSPFVQIPSKDRQAVMDAVAAVGVDRERISFDSDPRFGPFATVSVEVPVNEVETQGKQILDAIEKAAGRAQSTGVTFSLKDCSAASAPARQAAFDDARSRAEQMAQAAAVQLGPVAAISEQATPSPYGVPSSPCDGAGQTPKGANLQALDSPPEVRISVDLSVTFALAGDQAASVVTVQGTGSATARANEAYVAVLAQPNAGPFGPQAISLRDQTAVIDKIAALGIDKDDIEVTTPAFGGPTIVSVEVDVSKLKDLGDKVLDAVEAVFGRSQSAGVYYTHSNCLAVLAEAQKEALVDAENRARSLASAAGLHLAGLAAVADAAAQNAPYGLSSACNDDPSRLVLGSPYGPQLKPFDSEPEFDVPAILTVTYSVNP